MNSPPWIALDIGGANIKAAHTSGQARILPFELWKHPSELPRLLRRLASTFAPAERVAVTMTAELCDCFATQADGVKAVLDAVTDVYDERLVSVWGTDENFHSVADALARPGLAAAANWLALATLAARLVPQGGGLLIDIGSTTTDLIPFLDGRPTPKGRTDTNRLRSGELVYAGVRRTPVCALATELFWRGALTGLSAELFATTLDVYLTLGDVAPDPTDSATADGRPATVEAARDRLARMVGADRDRFSTDDAHALSLAADQALTDRLTASARRVCVESGAPVAVVVSGSGGFLARRVAERVVESGGSIIELGRAWGPVASGAGCAHALVVLAGERGLDRAGAS